MKIYTQGHAGAWEAMPDAETRAWADDIRTLDDMLRAAGMILEDDVLGVKFLPTDNEADEYWECRTLGDARLSVVAEVKVK